MQHNAHPTAGRNMQMNYNSLRDEGLRLPAGWSGPCAP